MKALKFIKKKDHVTNFLYMSKMDIFEFPNLSFLDYRRLSKRHEKFYFMVTN